jgi:radical SAM/Cys-rich protein
MSHQTASSPVLPGALEPFSDVLARHSLELRRGEAATLQVNVGPLCNQQCRHCHLEAGPDRADVMSPEIMDAVVAYAERVRFSSIDITGGAPELVPGADRLVERLASLTPRLLVRSNLTALAARAERWIPFLATRRVVLVTSFPSTDRGQTDAQRGEGTWATAIGMLQRLNAVGYGREGSGLELDLVANPPGAFLPPGQVQAEERTRRELARRWGITFNHLYTFANVPLGRFRTWLRASGNLAGYLERLARNFNPCTVDGLMCRTLVSVRWDGTVYDCDFNLACDLPLGGRRQHVSELTGVPPPGSPIATGDHCYACTAGSGFT